MAYQFKKINNFAKSGINTDLMPWDLPPEYLTHIRNIRIRNNKLSPFGSYTVWTDLPLDFEPGYLFEVGALSSNVWLILGKDKVYSYDGTTFSDISSVAGYAGIVDEDKWQGCLIGQVPVINNPSHYPEYWPQQNPAVKLLPLPWDASNTWNDVSESASIVRSHKQFLIAMDLQSGVEEIPDGVRWSSPADNASIPETWDPLDTTNVAGFTRLGGSGDRIIDGASLRDAFVIYRESSIYVMDFVGGQFVWQIRSLSDNIGLIAPDSIIEIKGTHYLIGDGDILYNDGHTIKSLLHNKIRNTFTANYDATNFRNSYAVKNNISSEIWFCIPETGNTYPNVAYIYNWEDDTWSIRDIPPGPFANYGPQVSPDLKWSDLITTWDTVAPAGWDQKQVTPLDDLIVLATKPPGVNTSGQLLFPSKGIIAANPFDAIIERVGYALEDLDTVTTMTRIYPHMTGPGIVMIQVGSQDYPGAPVRWKDAVSFNPVTDRKIDVRTTGELHCFRIFSNDTDSYWEISGIDIEYVIAGKR